MSESQTIASYKTEAPQPVNASSKTSVQVINPKFIKGRLAREWKTVNAMLEIYCQEQHGAALCSECESLRSYINLRLTPCRFGEEKPTCAKCPVHCYQRTRREQVKAMMRYAGPRMVWEHPWLSLRHLLDGWLSKSNLSPSVTR
jgi:Nitrous oxide-stimulated promoter.